MGSRHSTKGVRSCGSAAIYSQTGTSKGVPWNFKGYAQYRIESIAYRRGPGNRAVALSAAPSPFRSATAVRFHLDAPGEASVDVFDATGRLIRNLHDGWIEAGSHEIAWPGDTASGSQAVSGVYFIRLRSESRPVPY